MAKSYVQLFFLFNPEERATLEEKAYIAVEKALALDPDLADAYTVRGRLLWTPANHFPHVRAIQELRHALVLNWPCSQLRRAKVGERKKQLRGPSRRKASAISITPPTGLLARTLE